MKYDHISEQKIDLPWVQDFYQVSEDSIYKHKDDILDAIRTGRQIPEEFTGMTRNEVDKRFIDYLDELECLISFDLISIVEAFLMMDLKKRALEEEGEDIVNKEFLEIYNRGNVRLADVLDLWKKRRPETRNIVGEFKGIVNLRNWIAHGRIGELKLSARQPPENVYDICEKLLDNSVKIEP